jgi:hypothetical protein
MRRVSYWIAMTVLAAVAAGPLMAQGNPFVGTWKLNLAKSKFEGGPAPKSQTRTVTLEGIGAKYAFEGEAADGSKFSYSFTTAYDGKDCAITGTGTPGGADALTLKKGGDKTEGVLKKGGVEIGKATSEVSKDGKTTTVKIKGKTADGKEFKTEAVYDKQ